MLSVKLLFQIVFVGGCIDSPLTIRHAPSCKEGVLTYMSIRNSIKYWIDEGRLFELKPVLDSDAIERTLIVSKEIFDLLEGPWDDEPWARRCGRLRATLEAYVKGQRIGICLKPFKGMRAYMARLDKPEDEVWDIRAIDPNPGLRLFGRFADRDLFVALIWSPRSVEIPASQRLPLGPRESAEWGNAILECKAEWRKLFPSYQPIHGDEIHEYFENNVFPVGDS